jgi:tetratricopeptide (TPR) repeat protein
MKNSSWMYPILLAVPIACGTTRAETSREVANAAAAEAAAVAEPIAAVAVATAERGHDDPMRSDPTRAKRFAESYLAETEIEPRVTPAERDLLMDVFELITAEKLDEAARRLAKSISPTASAALDFTMGNIHYQREALDAAVAAYRAAVDKHPKFRRAWGMLAELQFRRSSFTDAIPAFTRVIELGGGDSVTYGLLGAAHANRGSHVAAESSFRVATMLDPEALDWRIGLARSLFEQGRHADAAALLDVLIGERPERPEFWLEQGKAYVRLARPLDAIENLEMVDLLGASSAASLNLLGDQYAGQRMYDLAVGCYLRALEVDSAAGVDRALRAAKYIAVQGGTAEVRPLLDGVESLRGAALDVGSRKDLFHLRARIAVAEGATDEEARALEQVVALDPMDGDALILLGRHHARNGDDQRAVFCFERAASIEAFEWSAKLRHAELLVGRRKYREALPLLRRVVALNPREDAQKLLDHVEREAKRGS